MATQATARPPFARRSRGLTTVTSAILIVVVLALVGVGTYAVMGGFSKPTPLTCQPLSAPACARFQNLHDVTLELPFKSIQEGNAVPFTVSLPSGESATSYNLNFGDGSPVVSSHSTSVEHAYSGIGTFIVYVTASVNGVLHDNLYGLVQVVVTSSYSSATAGTVPGIAGRWCPTRPPPSAPPRSPARSSPDSLSPSRRRTPPPPQTRHTPRPPQR
jgi:hypothetical protein